MTILRASAGIIGAKAPISDPDFASVMILAHCDGSDASTIFIDSSSVARTLTAEANAQIDTAQKKFGPSSGLFDGTGDQVTAVYTAGGDLDPGSGNFTLEFQFRINTATVDQEIAGMINSGSGLMVRMLGTNKVRGFITTADQPGGVSVDTSDTYSTGVWRHLAWVRDGNTMELFIEGVSKGTVAATGLLTDASNSKFSIGGLGDLATIVFNGWIDEFRYTVGVARYTSNFTPPTGPFPNS